MFVLKYMKAIFMFNQWNNFRGITVAYYFSIIIIIITIIIIIFIFIIITCNLIEIMTGFSLKW